MDGEQHRPIAGAEGHQHDAGRHQRSLQHQGQPDRDDRLVLEGDDEGQQIQGQRHDPEEGRRGHIGRQVRGDAEHQAGRRGRQQDQLQLLQPGDGRADRQRRRLFGRVTTAPDHDGQGRDHQDEDAIADAPAAALTAQGRQRLDQQRIGQQGQEAAQVRSGVEDIGILAVLMPGPHPRIPGLKQGRGRRQHGEGGADRQGQGGQKPADRRRRIRLAQGARDVQRQEQGRSQQQGQVHPHLHPDRADPLKRVGIGVAGQQRRLEEDHRGVPHRRRSPQHRQNQLGHHRLDHEDQRGRGEDGQGEQGGRQPVALASRRGGHCGVGHSRSPGVGAVDSAHQGTLDRLVTLADSRDVS